MFGPTNKIRLAVMVMMAISSLGLLCQSYKNNNAPSEKELAALERVAEYTVIDEELKVYSKVELDEEEKEKITEQIERLSVELPRYKKDFLIIITDDELEPGTYAAKKAMEDGGLITGKTLYSSKEIYLHKDFVEITLLHEIGHAVNFTHGFTYEKEFQEIFQKAEAEDYYTSIDSEYFAEGYSRFLKGELNENIREDAELISYFEKNLKIEY